MACSHATTCPLFGLLNESLDGWRRCYCDSADGWRGCARYQQSVRGQYVPLSLLPNGRDARHLQSAGAGRGADGTGPDAGAHLLDLLFEQAPVPGQAPPRAPAVPEPRRPVAAPAAREPGARDRLRARTAGLRRRWTQMIEWMRTPA